MGIRAPAVAGSFYPRDPDVLAGTVDAFMLDAPRGRFPKVLVVPHAGYIYSGAVAGRAYARWAGATALRRIVLLGPSHFVRLQGLVLPGAEAMATPLGAVTVDAAARASLGPHAEGRPEAHAREHSLEVQLPFLQRLGPTWSIVPLLAGGTSPESVAAVLASLWGGPETGVVISTDLSHDHPYAQAQGLDEQTAQQIEAKQGPVASDRACGSVPLNGLLHLARARGLIAERIDLRNSGDTAGDRDRVVGYGAFAFHEVAA